MEAYTSFIFFSFLLRPLSSLLLSFMDCFWTTEFFKELIRAWFGKLINSGGDVLHSSRGRSLIYTAFSSVGFPLWTLVPPAIPTLWLYLNSVDLPSSIWVPPPWTHFNRQGWQKKKSWRYLNCLPSLSQQGWLWTPQLSVSSWAPAGMIMGPSHLSNVFQALLSFVTWYPAAPSCGLFIWLGFGISRAWDACVPWNALWKLKLMLHCNNIKSWRVLKAG